MSARQRSAFILFDGIKPVQQVMSATLGLGITQLDVDHLVTHGFLQETHAPSPSSAVPAPVSLASAVAAPAPAAASGPAVATVAAPASSSTPQVRFAQAWPLATQLTASLGLRGFRLNLAIEAASGYDDLLALLPKIQAAVGVKKCEALESALKG